MCYSRTKSGERKERIKRSDRCLSITVSGNCFCFRVSWLLLFGKLQIIRILTNTNTTIRYDGNNGSPPMMESWNLLLLTMPSGKSSSPLNVLLMMLETHQKLSNYILLPGALLEVSDGRPSPLLSGCDLVV